MAGLLIKGTASADADLGGGAESDNIAFSDIFSSGTVAQAEMFIYLGALAWLVFVGAAVRQA